MTNGSTISYGTGDGQFYLPYGIAADIAGYVYVTDMQNSRIQKFTSDGTFVTKWGSYGTGDGQFYDMRGIAVSGDAHYVYVTDIGAVDTDGISKNQRIQKFRYDGTFVTKWGSDAGDSLFISEGVAVSSWTGDVYITDMENQCVKKFTSDGTFVTKFGSKGTGDGQFNTGPYSIAVDSNDIVYVADPSNNRVQKFKRSASGYYTLTVTKSDHGYMADFGGTTGISCGSTCFADYANNTSVSIEAMPYSGYKFTSWSGCDSVDGRLCTVKMSSDKTITAAFSASASSDNITASAAFDEIYNQYASWFGTVSGSVQTGSSGGLTYYLQWFSNGAALVAWTDGYIYTYNNGTSYALGVNWQTLGKAAAKIIDVYGQYASWFGTKSGTLYTGTSGGATYYAQWFSNGAALVAWTDGGMLTYYKGTWYALGVSWN